MERVEWGGAKADGEAFDALIVGAGPCGLAAAIAFKRAGLRAVVVDRGCVASGIALYPPYMSFFSTAERISIGGMPFVVATEKPTRRDALAYYRAMVTHFDLDVRQYEDVIAVEHVGAGAWRHGNDAALDDASHARDDDPAASGPSGGAAGGAARAVREVAAIAGAGPPPDNTVATISRPRVTRSSPAGPERRAAARRPDGARPDGARADGARFLVHSRARSGRARVTAARSVVVATGYFGTPSLLGVPGEEMRHVTHYFTEGHFAFQQNAVVVGGGNSAVDAALDLYRAGARVTIVHFGPDLDPNIKPWVLPDIANRIKDGSIGARWNSRVLSIDSEVVTIRTSPSGDPADHPDDAHEDHVAADHVFLATGFLPNTQLLEQIGVPLDPVSGVPEHDPASMETSVPGVFIAGVIASGYNANRIFIENGRDHGTLIVERLTR